MLKAVVNHLTAHLICCPPVETEKQLGTTLVAIRVTNPPQQPVVGELILLIFLLPKQWHLPLSGLL
jgi:hypothetical protein